MVLITAGAFLLAGCDSATQILENAAKEQLGSVTDSSLDGLARGDNELEKQLADARKDGDITNDERAAFMEAYQKDKIEDATEATTNTITNHTKFGCVGSVRCSVPG